MFYITKGTVMKLKNHFNQSKLLRQLENPPARIGFPEDFPDAMGGGRYDSMLAIIDQQLALHGCRLPDVDRINIAYPHKHRSLSHHVNAAEETATTVQMRLSELCPQVEWVLAGGLYEDKHLDRSGNQSIQHGLFAKQNYAIDLEMQDGELPFAYEPVPDARPELFLIADRFIEQGTTIANLYSFLTQNGAKVLGVMAPVQDGYRFRQEEIGEKLGDPRWDNGRIPELAASFHNSARLYAHRPDLGPVQCVSLFEEGLNRHGHSLFTLTDGECIRLKYATQCIYSARSPQNLKPWQFNHALRDMGVAMPAPAPAKTKASGVLNL